MLTGRLRGTHCVKSGATLGRGTKSSSKRLRLALRSHPPGAQSAGGIQRARPLLTDNHLAHRHQALRIQYSRLHLHRPHPHLRLLHRILLNPLRRQLPLRRPPLPNHPLLFAMPRQHRLLRRAISRTPCPPLRQPLRPLSRLPLHNSRKRGLGTPIHIIGDLH